MGLPEYLCDRAEFSLGVAEFFSCVLSYFLVGSPNLFVVLPNFVVGSPNLFVALPNCIVGSPNSLWFRRILSWRRRIFLLCFVVLSCVFAEFVCCLAELFLAVAEFCLGVAEFCVLAEFFSRRIFWLAELAHRIGRLSGRAATSRSAHRQIENH